MAKGRGRPKKDVQTNDIQLAVANNNNNIVLNSGNKGEGAVNKELEAKIVALARAEMARLGFTATPTSAPVMKQVTGRIVTPPTIPPPQNTGASRRLELETPLGVEREEQMIPPALAEEKNWAKLFAGNTMASKGLNLQFIALIIRDGVKIAQLEKQEVEKEAEQWTNALILYVVGDSPTIGAVFRFVNQWNLGYKPSIFYHEDGYFIIQLQNSADKENILIAGPHLINRRPAIVKPWSATFNFSDEILKTIPIWVTLPSLPLNCWSTNSLSKIASNLGTPICADECTSKKQRISYSRLLVEMDVTRAPPQYVKVMDAHGKLFDQFVSYEWWPQFCPSCCQIGHICPEKQAKQPQDKPKAWEEKGKNNGGPKKDKQAWQHKGGHPKGPQPVQEPVQGTDREEG
ncbi:uncharacterized protein LOC132600313 [Lycium barbarum]|uniref:uncharacterized protein LOC132600313 n=1 Tax=Lycium barbarum TaxID=112863 RepID=UPI00293F1A5E|nr:uncharacterized protein LOC132600313 [Lycium barbarum]